MEILFYYIFFSHCYLYLCFEDEDFVLTTYQELDSKICKIMKNPEPWQGDDLMKYSFRYYMKLEDLSSAAGDNLNIVTELKEDGGPRFIHLKLKNKTYCEYFGWNDNELDEFVQIIVSTKRVWNEILEHKFCSYEIQERPYAVYWINEK